MIKNRYKGYSDEELIPLLRGRRKEAEAAFTEFYNRYSQKVHAYCKYMVNNDPAADDIFQETFVRFYKNTGPESRHSNILGYLMTIARNLCLNFIRAKKPTIPVDDAYFLKGEDNSYERSEIFEVVDKSLDLMEEIYKEAFILREFNGLQYKEIAAITNTSLSNAKSRVKRAREKMMEILDPYIKDEM